MFLDEPTASLDPDIGDFVRSYIQEYKLKNQVTILLASHNMNEVERLCDSIIMMKKGKIIDRGTCKEIIKKHGRNNLEETFLKLARGKDEFNYHNSVERSEKLMNKKDILARKKANEELSKIFYKGSNKIGKF